MSIEYNDSKPGLSSGLQESAFQKYASPWNIEKNRRKIFVSWLEIVLTRAVQAGLVKHRNKWPVKY